MDTTRFLSEYFGLTWQDAESYKKLNPGYDSLNIYMSRLLSAYAATNNQLDETIKRRFAESAQELVAMRPKRGDTSPELGILRLQLHCGMCHPALLREPELYLELVHSLVSLGYDGVWSSCYLFVDLKEELRPEIDTSCLPGFHAMFNATDLHTPELLKHNIEYLMGCICHAVTLMAKKDPMGELIPTQIQQLRFVARAQGTASRVLYHTVYAWSNDLQRQALRDLILAEPGTPQAILAEDILDERYRNIGWAI